MQSAESAHGGLQKVTAFKKVHGSIVKILVCVSFVWYIWLRAKNCLKWGKIYIALEMLFAGGGEEGWDTGCLCTNAFTLGVSTFFFFPESLSSGAVSYSQNMKVGCRAFLREMRLFRSNAINSSKMFSLHFRTIFINLDFSWHKLFIISKGKNRQSHDNDHFFSKNEILW